MTSATTCVWCTGAWGHCHGVLIRHGAGDLECMADVRCLCIEDAHDEIVECSAVVTTCGCA